MPVYDVLAVAGAPEQNGVKVPALSDAPAQSKSLRHGTPHTDRQVGQLETHRKQPHSLLALQDAPNVSQATFSEPPLPDVPPAPDAPPAPVGVNTQPFATRHAVCVVALQLPNGVPLHFDAHKQPRMELHP